MLLLLSAANINIYFYSTNGDQVYSGVIPEKQTFFRRDFSRQFLTFGQFAELSNYLTCPCFPEKWIRIMDTNRAAEING